MTHGEMYVYRRANLDFTHDIDKIVRQLDKLPKRMPRIKAMRYYNQKLRKIFGIEEVNRRDFVKVEHYFDYFEAKRMVA